MISCDRHDYVEIACMYHFPLRLTLKNKTEVEGIAQDTVRENGQECIQIKVNQEHKNVPLDQLKKMVVLKDNPHFSSLEF